MGAVPILKYKWIDWISGANYGTRVETYESMNTLFLDEGGICVSLLSIEMRFQEIEKLSSGYQ